MPVHTVPLPTVLVLTVSLPTLSLHPMLLPMMALPTVPLPALQAAFKCPVAASGAGARAWDWGSVKAEDKTLLHQVRCHSAAGIILWIKATASVTSGHIVSGQRRKWAMDFAVERPSWQICHCFWLYLHTYCLTAMRALFKFKDLECTRSHQSCCMTYRAGSVYVCVCVCRWC